MRIHCQSNKRVINRYGFASAIFTVFMAFVIGAFLVGLLDFGRAYIVQSQLRAMTDAAALAAAQAYEDAECKPPACQDDPLEVKRDAAYAAAQLVADNNEILGLGAMNLGESNGIILGNYQQGGTFQVQDPLEPEMQINSARVKVKLGELGNPLFNLMFNNMHTPLGDTMALAAEATGTMDVTNKTLLMALTLDSSESMAWDKYCPTKTPSKKNCNLSPFYDYARACQGVEVGGVNVPCPPAWYPGTPNKPQCHPDGLWADSRFAGWCNLMPDSLKAYQLPANADWPYPDMRWVPEPMYTTLEAAKLFVDEVSSLNPSGAADIDKHHIGINRFTKSAFSDVMIDPTTSYQDVKDTLIVDTIYPMFESDVCEGLTDAFTMLETGWQNYTGDKDKLFPVIVFLAAMNPAQPDKVCNVNAPTGATGRANTLTLVDAMDDQFFSLTGKRVTIFTVMVAPPSPEIEAFMQALARNDGTYIFSPVKEDIADSLHQVIEEIKVLRLTE